MTHPRVPHLIKIAIFKDLPRESLNRLAEASGLQSFAAGTYLFEDGGEPDFVYCLVEGSVALMSDSSPNAVPIENFSAGETVLLPAALLGLPYLLSGKAIANGKCLLIPSNKLRALIDTDGALAAQCARALSRHWRLLVGQLKELKTHNAVQRLARYLVSQAGEQKGKSTLTFATSKRDIAGMLGIAPETLSRALKKLKPHGVETHGETLTIKAIEKLELIASGPLDTGKPH